MKQNWISPGFSTKKKKKIKCEIDYYTSKNQYKTWTIPGLRQVWHWTKPG